MSKSSELVGLQVLRMPLFQLPQLVTQLVNARVALTRLEELLAASQQDLLKLRDPPTKGCHHLPMKVRLSL